MKVNSSRRLPTDTVLVIGLFGDRRPEPGAATYLKKMGGWVDEMLDVMEFDASPGSTAVLPWPDGAASQVVIVGLGDEVDADGLRRVAAGGRKAIPGATRMATTLHQIDIEGAVESVVDGFGLADYRFETYKSSASEREELSLTLLGAPKGWEAAADRSRVVVGEVLFARDLVNTPAADKAPLVFSDLVRRRAEAAGLTVDVVSGERLETERLRGLVGVGRGSHRPPCLLHVAHTPKKAKAHLAFVGKGIIFDSGGLSLKTPASMEAMKDDMAGAAAVVAAAVAIARLDLPVRVDAYAALAENLPGGGAQRPGDVIRYRNGKTVEVLNTDAEGRLVLADALCVASEQEPDLIVDLATLTGAITVALGPRIAGLFGNDQEVVDRVRAAAAAAGERVWPMPLPGDYRSFIDSSIADMKNTGKGRFGGAITAAHLLAEFVGEVPWAHLDIAGAAYLDEAHHEMPKGGTGFGVRTLVELAASSGG